jgi:predicted lipid-binding transport protein (Tim44 family)
MKTLAKLVAATLFAIALPNAVWARGGGGCIEEGTLITIPHGAVAIEALRSGDVVVSVTNGQRVEAVVQSVFQVQPDEYVELVFGERVLRVTPEHPVAVSVGVFRVASQLRAGDHLDHEMVTAVRRVRAERPAYNLLVSPCGTFFANGVLLHNKGCFLPDTPILRADGTPIPIRDVRAGDELLAFTSDGTVVTANVRNVIAHEVDEYAVVATDHIVLRVTMEHPFYVGDGTFKTLEALQVGDTIFAFDGHGLSAQQIVSVERVAAPTQVYNLQTDVPHTFFANGVAVHNKGGGCFAAGTPILTPHGEVAIETLQPGDVVLTGNGGATSVEATFVTRAPVLALETDAGTLRTTAEHPLLDADGEFRLAGEFKCGDWLSGATVQRCVTGPEQLVFNLRVGPPHTFVAGGFIVHNKGGGGGFHGGGYHGGVRSSGTGNEDPTAVWFIIIIIGVIIVVKIAQSRLPSREDENLDYSFSDAEIAPKALKTRKLLEFIARVDSEFASQKLTEVAQTTFVKLQQCWQARDYAPMQPLLMPDLYAEHCGQIRGMVRNHEINIIDQLAVESVAIVNVRYPHKKNDREFTALITASARDYYVDDRTQEFQRGDEEPARFQEFWTFQRQDRKWLLREIEQTRESDKLKEENLFEPFTDKGVEQVYGEAAKAPEAPAGPWLEKAVETKATRVDRLLNFLVQTDKLWDRQAMLERARQVFTKVFLAREAGDVTQVPDADLFPAVALDLRQEINKRRQGGFGIQFRNFCIRKAEMVLVRNFADNARDEFVMRISAHAQRVVTKNGAVLSQDEYVKPFEEYWTFGRLGNCWALKEVLPPSQGAELVDKENLDQDSSPDQLQWYYRQTRA